MIIIDRIKNGSLKRIIWTKTNNNKDAWNRTSFRQILKESISKLIIKTHSDRKKRRF
jgi:hypothetical protein